MWLRRIVVALLTATLLSSVSVGSAQAQTSTTQAFTLPAGGRAVITFEAYCLDFGDTFPTAIQAPNAKAGLAPSTVRAALAYIQTNNLSSQTSTALQAQYAIWRLAGAQGTPKGNATADAVVAAAKTTPGDPANATSIIVAANNGSVDLDAISWDPIGNAVEIVPGAVDHFYGRGLLVVKNLTNQSLTLFMPIGTIIPPAGYRFHQRTVAYATNVQINPKNLPDTAAGDVLPLLALLLAGGALPVHLWRKRREQLIWRRAA